MKGGAISRCMAMMVLAWGTELAAQEPVKGIVALKDSGPVTYGRSAKIKAKVEAVDLDTRHLTVKSPKGFSMTMRVEPRVRNLSEVRVGDEVVLRYNEAVGLEVKIIESEEVEPEADVSAEIPEQEADDETQVADGHRVLTAVVESVAIKQRTLVLKDERGNFHSLYIRDAKVLEELEAGMPVRAVHTEAAVVFIELPDLEKDKLKKKKKR